MAALLCQSGLMAKVPWVPRTVTTVSWGRRCPPGTTVAKPVVSRVMAPDVPLATLPLARSQSPPSPCPGNLVLNPSATSLRCMIP